LHRVAPLLLLLYGCATNSVTSLLKASHQTDAIVPSASVVQSELTCRAFEVGTIGFDLRKKDDKQGPGIPDAAYLELFESQLKKAFKGAGLAKGTTPAYPVNVAIERIQLKPATFLVAEPSVFRVRMEIVPPGGEALLRGQFQTFFPPPVFFLVVNGVMTPVAIPTKDWEYVALAKMFPAVAIVIAATTQGLQQGKTLDEIRIYPKDIEAGTLISPDLFLQDAPFGVRQMSSAEVRKAIKAAKTPDGL